MGMERPRVLDFSTESPKAIKPFYSWRGKRAMGIPLWCWLVCLAIAVLMVSMPFSVH
jgi:hypothetical protein